MSEKSRLNVLVVDPDEATVLDLKEMISELGYRVSSNTKFSPPRWSATAVCLGNGAFAGCKNIRPLMPR